MPPKPTGKPRGRNGGRKTNAQRGLPLLEETIAVRVSLSDRSILETFAAQQGKSLTDYLRGIVAAHIAEKLII